MISDFSAARLRLEQAYHHLDGDDEVSASAREALDLLIEAMAHEQFKRPTASAKVLDFPKPYLKRKRRP
ncbi:hypothetical protein [Pseudaminobacter sp. NGMCC 1.201702]|uniref:hypothetical protein n=1 Tax=Pseudaminobacter sp. NGMCC 1.201702 TaxID=3391825 RepID=UPI0039EE8E62